MMDLLRMVCEIPEVEEEVIVVTPDEKLGSANRFSDDDFYKVTCEEFYYAPELEVDYYEF